MVRRLSAARLVGVAVAAPAVVLACLSALMLLAAARGQHPFWIPEALNIAESAALRDGASVIAGVRRGEDPFLRRPVRAGLLFDREVLLSPLEAAIASRRGEVVYLLLAEFPPRSPDAWNQARCIAGFVGDQEVVSIIERVRPEGPPIDCASVHRPW